MAALEGGHGGWWGAQQANDRSFMIGWALPDFHGPSGPGINFLTRLTLLREINYDAKFGNLVSNPVPELVGLRTGSLASEQGVALSPSASHAVAGTAGGAAASADVNVTFSGFKDGSVFGVCVLGNSNNSGLGVAITVHGTSATVAVDTCGAVMAMSTAAVANTAADGLKSTGNPVMVDSKLTVRVLADRSLADFFVQHGQWSGSVAWLAKAPRAAGDSTVSVWSQTPGITANIDVYGMGCGWETPSWTDHPTM
jgi:hypothetical protein